MNSEQVITQDDLPADVLEAILEGRKVEAIKRLRIATGMGLANAKVLVDSAARRHGMQREYPAMTDSRAIPFGLLKMLVLMIAAFAVYQYFMA